jgi:DNA processing protein
MSSGNFQSVRDPLAWLGLSLVRGLVPTAALELARRAGGARAACGLSTAALKAAGIRGRTAADLRASLGRADAEAAAIAAAGATLVTWGDDTYPHRLRDISEPPLALAVRGTLVADEPAVAVVGARRASAYGRRVAEELARGLAESGLAVVSGLAAGIDAAAHEAALAAGGRTIAVLGTGIDQVYPPWHVPLARRIVESGALVSEFPCGARALAFHFPRRNRVIAGLALGTVVVEAAERSGSLITARCALEQGREVFAVPGPLGVAQHRGPHRLIREGATLVTGVDDVLCAIAPALLGRLAAARAARAVAALSAEECRVLEAVGVGVGHIDDVIRRTGLAPAAALETLLALELRGLVAQEPGKRFRRRAA